VFRVRGAALVLVACVCLGGVLVQAECTCEDLKREIARCASLEGELMRLACYDQLARACGLLASSPDKDNGKWVVNVETNPLDDSKMVALVLTADTGATRLGEKVVLVLRCMSGETKVFIIWSDYLGSGSGTDVTWRVGDSPATTARWRLSTDSTTTFYPYDAIAFIGQLIGVSRLVAQVTPYNESPITAVFDLRGLANAVRPLREACGW